MWNLIPLSHVQMYLYLLYFNLMNSDLFGQSWVCCVHSACCNEPPARLHVLTQCVPEERLSRNYLAARFRPELVNTQSLTPPRSFGARCSCPPHSQSDSHQDHESTLHSLNMINHFVLKEGYFCAHHYDSWKIWNLWVNAIKWQHLYWLDPTATIIVSLVWKDLLCQAHSQLWGTFKGKQH